MTQTLRNVLPGNRNRTWNNNTLSFTYHLCYHIQGRAVCWEISAHFPAEFLSDKCSWQLDKNCSISRKVKPECNGKIRKNSPLASNNWDDAKPFTKLADACLFKINWITVTPVSGLSIERVLIALWQRTTVSSLETKNFVYSAAAVANMVCHHGPS